MICPHCDKEQMYPRKQDGVFICNFCGKPLPKPKKAPDFPLILMDNLGHSRKLRS